MTKCINGVTGNSGNEICGRNCGDGGVVLGVDGGATSTTCVCISISSFSDPKDIPDHLPILGQAVSGCSNHNSVGEVVARHTLEKVMMEALLKSGSTKDRVRAVCLGVSGVNHQNDRERISSWLRQIFPHPVELYVHNDAVAALASGTTGKLHGCVLIAGTGSIAYGFTEDGEEVRTGGGGPILGDWGSGYGIAAQALTAVLRAHDGRGKSTMLTPKILEALSLPTADELIRWTYADSSWARIAAIVPIVVSCAEAGDETAINILVEAVQELAHCVKTIIQRLHLCGKDGSASFPIVLVGGVLEANQKWDIAKEVMKRICQEYPGAYPVRPKVEPAVGAALLAWNILTKRQEAVETTDL